MKKVLILLLFTVATNSCKQQSNEFTLIGKWICTEEHGSNGAEQFVRNIKNGDVLLFRTDSTVTDKQGIKGLYNLKGDRLHIDIQGNERFYILYKIKDDFDKISLIPVSPEYQIICDEGCAFVYEKVN